MFAIPAGCVSADQDPPRIAKWYMNKQAAVSLRFDDSDESHVKHAIPMLNERGMKATFMINPGKRRYQRHRHFWETEVPRMGHRMGNHTMHHRGAKNLEEAEYEIGAVTRLTRPLYPEESHLNVFASGGGGVKWGGELWENADGAYKQLIKKYQLIDLYDGFHRSKPYNSGDTPEDYCGMVQEAIRNNSHKALHFHTVGPPNWKDRLTKLLKGVSLDVDLDTFAGILDCIDGHRNQVWVAPLIDILKYEAEYRVSDLSEVDVSRKKLQLALGTTIDTELYDHRLTLVIPDYLGAAPVSVTQNGDPVQLYPSTGHNPSMADVKAMESTITIHYR